MYRVPRKCPSKSNRHSYRDLVIILPDPDPPEACDLLILESTYGDRNHENRAHRLTGYSAHADQQILAAWVAAMPEPPAEIRLVHGEPVAKAALAKKMRKFFTKND